MISFGFYQVIKERLKSNLDNRMKTRLYKYFPYDDNFKSCLKEGYLWFSKAESFNDPFEFKLQVKEALTDEEILEFFKLYKNKSVSPLESITNDFNKVLFRYRQDPKTFTDLFLKPFVEHISRIGVCCFSYTWNNILMWSHYADNHKGVVCEFDSNMLESSIGRINNEVNAIVIGAVDYSPTFPLINVSSSHTLLSAEVRRAIFTKSIEWQYEKEVRILSNQTGRNQINRNSISKIYLGARFSEKNKTEILDLAKQYFPKNQPEIINTIFDDRNYSLKEGLSPVSL